MIEHSSATEMTQEDQLKAIVYQFITLYERWSEDRQVAAKQGADMATLVKLFIEQVKGFKQLEPQVRKEIASTIYQAATAATKEMTEKISKTATEEMDANAKRLHKAVDAAIHQLNAHQKQQDKWFYGLIAAFFGAAILSGGLFAYWIMPQPYLPLTGAQLQTYQNGQFIETFWPKLSKKEQQSLRDLGTKQSSTKDENGKTINAGASGD